ncbi:hypothetical protein [Effusibacillus pohliae]|uniref:hypothetical protein n=1 Tax=Effusibacillus pohliae TaxID=232270 RepID=UPI000367F1AE|nr:hypothetical protein [Effusibacillus pohliae]
MPQKRKDAEYLQQRVRELYKHHTAKQVAEILNEDHNILAPVTERIVYNVLQDIRTATNEAETYKDKPWSDFEDDFLRQWYAQGASIPHIAQQLQRSIPSIHGRVKNLGLANRKVTPEQERAIRAMLQLTRMSMQEIAYELGVKYQAVRHISNKVKKETGVSQRRTSDTSFFEEGSLAERLIRNALVERYGDAVIPWQHNRDWSQGRGWQIDIPLKFEDGLKVAIEVNHVRTHADRRNRDYAKRRFAEELGWIWVPIWMLEEPTKEAIVEAVDTIIRIVEDLLRGERSFYDSFIADVEEKERFYYAPDQPPFDPKEEANFGMPWSVDDTNIVLHHYGHIPLEELQAKLSTPRSSYAISHKARSLGLTKQKKNFSAEEDEIIRKYYPTGTENEIMSLLPGRTWTSIVSRANRLGVKRRDEWTPEEEVILVEHYSSLSYEELQKLLPGRSIQGIRTRANRLRLKRAQEWSPDEDETLRQVYPEEPREVIQAALPHRSWQAIVSRASRLGIRRMKPF